MAHRLIRAAVAVAAAGMTVAGLATLPATGSTYQSAPWSTDGYAVGTGQPAPNVPGATGSFTMGSLTNTTGAIQGAENSSGQITVYVESGTRFYACDSTGLNCTTSDQAHVVQVGGAQLYVSGRYFLVDGSYELFANYVFSPPPAPNAPPPPPPANPTPTSVRDYTMQDLYGVIATVTGTHQDLIGSFVLGKFQDYGCGLQPDCQVQEIALAHNDSLLIHPQPETAYWLSTDGGCTYAKTTDTYTAVSVSGTASGASVNGHYTWTGTDWSFFASNFFTPPPAAPSACPSSSANATLSASANLVEQNAGTYDPTTSTYNGTQWTGQMGPTGPFGGGTATMTLSFQRVTGGWHYSGVYTVAAPSGSQNSLSGAIDGVATDAASATGGLGSSDAQITVDQAAGQFAGYSGSGRYHGDAVYVTSPSPTPPSQSTGTFTWVLVHG